MKQPRISVVVPVYNVEKYLDRCLNSLVSQTIEDFEIILIDDKSTDNSPVLCDKWAKSDSRIRVFHKQQNEGLGYARNTGIEVAQGKYIVFPDSDDYLEKNTLEILYDYAEKDCLDAVYYEFCTDEYPGFHAVSYQEGLYCGKEIEGIMLDIIGGEPEYDSDVKFQVSAAKVMYSLKTIRDNNLRFVSEREIISEDLIWNLGFLHCSSKIRTIDKRLYHYCLNTNSLSHTHRSDRYQRIKQMDSYLQRYEEWFENKMEFSLRLNRTILFHLRGRLLYLLGNKAKASELQNVLDDPSIKRRLYEYPVNRMPLRYRLFYLTVRNRCFFVLRFFTVGKSVNDFYRVMKRKMNF